MELSVSSTEMKTLQRITEIECGLPMDPAEASDELPEQARVGDFFALPSVPILDTKR